MPTGDWKVDLQNPTMTKSFLELAEQYGWEGTMFGDHPKYYATHFLIYCDYKSGGCLHGYSTKYLNIHSPQIEGRIITIDEAIRIISNPLPKTVPELMINGHRLIVSKNGIKIGCQTISPSEIETIYSLYKIYKK